MSQLVDSFGRKIEYLRLSVTDRCDLRCFYCIPKGYKGFSRPEERITLDDFVRLVRLFSELGVSKVRLTGGEPLVRADLPEMVRKIGALPMIQDISLSTNAARLSRHAQILKEAGVSRINVSLDTLNPHTFKEITQGELGPVLHGLQAAREAGFHPIKVNMVVMRDINLHEVGDMVDYCLDNGFTLRFIETMPVGAGGQHARGRYVGVDEVRGLLQQRFELEPARMTGAGPAEYLKIVGKRLKIGFITPISRHFCETCNRVRLSSEGTLYLCLGQNDRLELRPLIRQGQSDDEIKTSIMEAVLHKPEGHEFSFNSDKIARIMSKTGG